MAKGAGAALGLESLDHGGEARIMSLLRLFAPWRNVPKGKVSPPPTAAFERYTSAARALGLDGLYLFLSFDCDTDLDIAAVLEVHAFLAKNGIKATYAVPGAQLERGAETYRKLAMAGAEFMNHGGRPHAEWRDDHWVGITFYNEMTEDAVVDDIRRGHAIVTEVIGKPPLGFRAPHFGCYNDPGQVDTLHRTAAALGYEYASTTIPRYGLEYGPGYLTHGLVELPCFGSFRNPATILDSWTYLTDRKKYALGSDYYELWAETLRCLTEQRIPALLTWYADPCHVLGQQPFVKAIELASRTGIRSMTGAEAAGMLRAALAE
jgi:hypothetical protein